MEVTPYYTAYIASTTYNVYTVWGDWVMEWMDLGSWT